MSARAFRALIPVPSRATILVAAAYLAAYLALDWASYIRPLQGLNITPWNPQPALAIALLVWSRQWLGLVWLGLVAAELLVRGVPVNWLAGLTASIALSLTYAAIARALGQRTDLSHPFATRKDLAWFAVIVAIGSLVSALLYVMAFWGGGFGGDSIYGAVVRYWIGDAVGLVVTLPVLLIAKDRAHRAPLVSTLKSASWWMTTVLTCVCLVIIFGRREEDYFKYFYLLLLPVAWAAARFGVAGAVLSSAVTQLGLIAAAQLALRHDLTVFELQALMTVSTITALLVGVLVDEQAIAAAELRTSLRFAAAGQMAAALAHELSQPLTALSNYAHACRTIGDAPGSLDSKQAQHLSEIMDRVGAEAQRAGDIVRRLRDFFKSGATSLELIPLESVLRQALETNAPFATRMGVALAGHFNSALPPVWIDPLQLAVVLRNLITNAIESASTQASRKEVFVRARLERRSVLIEVEDTGAGVDPGRIQTLFDAAPSRKSGGLGVGLSICRAIVEAHGGKLWAESGPGGHFLFLLPIDDNEFLTTDRASRNDLHRR